MSEGPKKPKYSATRRLLLKTKLLKKATSMLVEENKQKKNDKDSHMDGFPKPKLAGLSVQELQDLCKDLHRKIDEVDEARYDLEMKIDKSDKEIQTLTQKVNEMRMKTAKRPNLKRVKKTADISFAAGPVSKADFKANLKTVKKEEEKKEEVTDWRKNVEAMSGMDGRKKMFNAGQ